jgi:SulP family sulfate permease
MWSFTSLILGGKGHGIIGVGELPVSLPPPSMPDFSTGIVRELAPDALAVGLLGLILALSIARSISTYSRQYIDASQEFIGQGLSNIVGSFFSSYAGSGSFTRSGINYFSGAMTPLSSVFSAVLVALILLLVAPLTAYLPMPAMGGVILFVAYHLIDFHYIRDIFRTSRQEMFIVVTTFLATLFLDLEFAIYAGVLLSLMFYLHRTTHPSIVNLAPNPDPSGQPLIQMEKECPQFKILRIDGSLFFGAIDHVATYLQEIDKNSTFKRHILIVAYGINFLDLAGAEMLANESRRRRRLRGGLYLCGLKREGRDVLERGGYIDIIGRENIFATETEAISKICDRLDTAQCRLCGSSLFPSCKQVQDPSWSSPQ